MSDKLKVIPRGQYVLVKPELNESKVNEHGLLIPSSVEKEQRAQGTVIHAGDVAGINRGDVIVYGAFAGETLKVREGKKEVEYRLVHDEDIIAFIR